MCVVITALVTMYERRASTGASTKNINVCIESQAIDLERGTQSWC